MPRHRSARQRVQAVGVVSALVLMAGCGAVGQDEVSPVTPAETSSGDAAAPAPEPFPAIGQGAGKDAGQVGDDGLSLEDVEAMADLAALAEQLAGEQPTVPARDGSPVLGSDISWPQCPTGMGIPQKRSLGLPGPLPAAEFVVVGLTNGPGFYPNPCLAEQVHLAHGRGLLLAAYAVVSYPDETSLERFGDDGPYVGSDRLGALRNVGYQQALYNVRSMRSVGLDTPIVWIDVEPVRFFDWSADTDANAAVVEGNRRGYEDAGYRTGVYSTAYLWDSVVGDLSLGVPEWRAAGQTSREEALARCGADSTIQGGGAVLGQWVEAERDQNVTCPGISRDLGRWFHPS